MSKSKPRQLFFVFADSPQGNGQDGTTDASVEKSPPVHTAENNERPESTPSPAIDMGRLLARVASPGNLEDALARVVSNKGAPGVDGKSVMEISRAARVFLPKLRRALLSESYVPGDIRRVWIPKPSGGQRGLGIPNVVDRVVQQAVLQVLEPIYDPTFHDSSHGFRPRRGAQTAIAEVVSHTGKGARFVVDIDLSKFFDRVSHQRLLSRLGQRVTDRGLLRVIRLMLKAKVVFPDGTRVSSPEGTPQGGPLSPLLSNIVLDELDWELERRGLAFVRYADDCNVYVGSERAGIRVMASLRRFIEGRLRLEVNLEKSAVARAGTRHFLGFCAGTTSEGRVFVRLSQRSIDRLADKVRDLTRRNQGRSMRFIAGRVNRYLQGWMGYFRLCTSAEARRLKSTDAHIRRRLRAAIVRQKKRSRFLYRALRRQGVSPSSAWKCTGSRRGPWWQSNTGAMQRAYPNPMFGGWLLSLHALWRAKRFDWRPYWALPD